MEITNEKLSEEIKRIDDRDKEIKVDKCTEYKTVFHVSFVADWQFLALLPALNINFHSRSLELEWLFFGMYIDKV